MSDAPERRLPAAEERPSAARRLAGGGSLVLGADALQLPATLLLAAYLGRRLGVEGLALYLLAAAVVGWLELALNSLFSRAAVQLTAQSGDWRPIAALVLRWHLRLALSLMLAVWLALWLAAAAGADRLFGVEGLREALLLFALEIPLFALARAHTHVLTGRGRFAERAWCSAARWTSRLALSVALVEVGLGVRGAVLGAVASTAVELAVARRWQKTPWRSPAPAGLRRRLAALSLPLFLHGVSLQLFHRLGLLLLVPLGAPVAAAGLYGAADSLLRLRRVLGGSLTPLLLATLSELVRDRQPEEARRLARTALRLVAWTCVPVAAAAGAAAPLMAWLFGAPFRAGGPVLALLVWATPALLLLSVAAAVLVAADRPRDPVRLTVPMVALAAAGYLLAVPRWGALGAAAVTTATAALAAAAFLVALWRAWSVTLPPATLARTTAAAAATYLAATRLPAEGAWLLVALPALVAAGTALIVVLGEAEWKTLRRLGREGTLAAGRLGRAVRAEETSHVRPLDGGASRAPAERGARSRGRGPSTRCRSASGTDA